VVVDSIQAVEVPGSDSPPGSVGQVRAAAAAFVRFAKEAGTPVLLVGHVTKEGALAGPKVLEHMVDTVLDFEGERAGGHRILRATKNRFGATDEVAVFEMTGSGLVEVPDASALLLGEREGAREGAAVCPAVEGTRVLLVELQALVARSAYTPPRRRTSGLDRGRVEMALAVLERRADLSLADRDVFGSAVGGVQVREPAADLAVALAIASSARGRPVPADLVAFGELGLGGELRAVRQVDARLREAARLGFRRAVVPARGKRIRIAGIEPMPARTIQEALGAALG
jgi:DNA repair protein RadA/Sms